MTAPAAGSFERPQAQRVRPSSRELVASAWRASATQEFRIVSALADSEPNAACFHAHEAGEKILKAASVAIGNGVPRTHVLTLLLDALATVDRAADEPVVAAARVLDRNYSSTRYPDAVGDIDPARFFSPSDARDALALARTVIAFADGIVADAFGEPPQAHA